jgi:hypothetical protein
MVVCNPRDREAAHRAQVEAIATDNFASVTCKKRTWRGRQSRGSTGCADRRYFANLEASNAYAVSHDAAPTNVKLWCLEEAGA